ncbi:MAG: hypothetical protein KGI66_02455, partial [Patescibacteria group bacterium]|nr:hypothetical protein [Patescibacteria group bacterium]
MLDKIAIPYLYNMHGHLRQGRTLALTVKIASMWCWFYAAMGNTKPPILTLADAMRYDEEIDALVPSGSRERFKALVVV